MEENKKKLAGYIFLGIFGVLLVLVIVGMCAGGIADTNDNGTGKNNFTLFSDEITFVTGVVESSPTLSIVGFVIVIVGICALVTYLVLKLFLKKNIRIIGILGGLAALIGSIVVMVGTVLMLTKLNTLNFKSETNLLLWNPNGVIVMGIVSGVVAAIVGFVAASKKFNR